MRRHLITAFLIVTVVLLAISAADACGDKALRIGRGIRFQRTSHPLAVLIYIPSNAKRAEQLQSFLKKIGHKPYSAETSDRAGDALKSGQYDLVFVEIASASGLQAQLSTTTSKALLVPVVSEGTKAEVAAAQKQYKCFVKNPHSADRYLDAIDQAMSSRVRLIAKKV